MVTYSIYRLKNSITRLWDQQVVSEPELCSMVGHRGMGIHGITIPEPTHQKVASKGLVSRFGNSGCVGYSSRRSKCKIFKEGVTLDWDTLVALRQGNSYQELEGKSFIDGKKANKNTGCKEYELRLLRTELEKVKQEKEGVDFKIAKFDKSAKDFLNEHVRKHMTGKHSYLSDFEDFDLVVMVSFAWRKTMEAGITGAHPPLKSAEGSLLDILKLQDKNDASKKSPDDNSLKDNGTAVQQVNTARPELNTGSREVSTAIPEVNTANPEDLVGPSHASEDTQVEEPESSVQTRRMTTSYSEQGFLSAIYEGKTHQALHTCLFACFLSQEEPKRVSKALSDPTWITKQGLVAQGHISRKRAFTMIKALAPVARIVVNNEMHYIATPAQEACYDSWPFSLVPLVFKRIFDVPYSIQARYHVCSLCMCKVSSFSKDIPLAVKRIFRYLKGKPSLGLCATYTNEAGYVGIDATLLFERFLPKGFDAGRFQYLVSIKVILLCYFTKKPKSIAHHQPFLEILLKLLMTSDGERIRVLEDDLKKTKQTYSSAFTKLILKVKKLESKVKTGKARKRARVVVSEDEEDDSSKQGRIDEDPNMYFAQDDEVVHDQDTAEEGQLEDSTTGITVSTAPINISTARETHSTTGRVVYGRRSKEARKDKGKEIMTEPEPEKKSKKLLEQERLGLEETTTDVDWMILQFQKYWDMKNKPKSEAQARKNMIVYLKNQSNYKMKYFEEMNYDEIRPIFEKIWDFNHNFVPMDLEIEKEKEEALLKDLKGYLDIVPREDVAVDVDSLSTKYPIVDWKTYTLSENFMYYKIIKRDGSSKNYKIMSKCYMILIDKLLWSYKAVKESSHSADAKRNCIICLHKRKYPISQEMISKMLSKRLEVVQESTQAYELLKFIRSQVKK
ncbi:hypothetical protein Tco_0054582 [Tanacetum coccineum]